MWLTAHSAIPYVIGGDFNAIRSLDQKKGASHNMDRGDEIFNHFIDSQQLIEPFCIQGNFTWSNGQSNEKQILTKLDQFLHNAHWTE